MVQESPQPDDHRWMTRALELAAHGRGRVEPNPLVGAVLVKAGELVGEGYHAKFGEQHAERAALADAGKHGNDPRSATCYVTLEPCAHYGKTPPCTDALLQAGVARVVTAMIDPDDRVAGRGVELLRGGGVEVEVGVMEVEARRLNAGFVKRQTRGLPLVTAKWAMTLDGRTADANSSSQWISNARSRQVVHALRARVDAILVGIGTVLADDPSLTARDVEVLREARRVVVDPRLEIPDHAKLLTDDGPPVTIATSTEMAKSPRAQVESAGYGAAVLASPTVYEGSIVEGETGLIYRSLDEFEVKLRQLIRNTNLRHQLALNAYNWVRENRLLCQHYRQRRDWYLKMREELPRLNEELKSRVSDLFVN